MIIDLLFPGSVWGLLRSSTSRCWCWGEGGTPRGTWPAAGPTRPPCYSMKNSTTRFHSMVGGQSCVLYTVLSYLYQHVACQIHMVQNDNQWWLMKNNDDHIQTFSDYIQYFAPDFTLHPDVSTKQENLNTKQVHLEISLSHFDTAEEVLDWKENIIGSKSL